MAAITGSAHIADRMMQQVVTDLGCRHIVHVPSGCVPIFLGNPRRGDRSVIDADGVW